MRRVLPGWCWRDAANAPIEATPGDSHLALARESLRELLDDRRVPPAVRQTLADDYRQLELLLDKLEQGHIYIAVFGQVQHVLFSDVPEALLERLDFVPVAQRVGIEPVRDREVAPRLHDQRPHVQSHPQWGLRLAAQYELDVQLVPAGL